MKTLYVIIPVFNEEKTIQKVLRKVAKQKIPEWRKEIIIVNDGSTDKTLREIEEFRFKGLKLRVINHKTNLGKGSAVRSALKVIKNGAVIIQDADLEYDPGEWGKMIKVFESGTLVVYGSRNLKPKRQGYKLYVFGVWLLTSLVNDLYKSKLTDIYTCYKLLDSKILISLDLKSDGFEIEAEITAKLLSRNYFIEEVAINYQPRSFLEGKKIKSLDGLRGAWVILDIFMKSRLILNKN